MTDAPKNQQAFSEFAYVRWERPGQTVRVTGRVSDDYAGCVATIMTSIGGVSRPTHTARLTRLKGRYGCDHMYAIYEVSDVEPIDRTPAQKAADDLREAQRRIGRQNDAGEDVYMPSRPLD